MSKSFNQGSEQIAISRAYKMLAQEVGHVMASIAFYEQIVRQYGAENARRFLQENGRAFPVLSIMGDEDGVHRIYKRIRDLNAQLYPILESKTDIVCIGAEAAWLDIVTHEYFGKTFHIVPHSINADLDRFLANYGDNVRIHNSVDLTHLYGTTSIVITFAFDVTDHTFLTYPVAHRVCGRDTRQSFSELIALDILESAFRFFPTDLVEIDCDEMTYILSRQRESMRRPTKWKLSLF